MIVKGFILQLAYQVLRRRKSFFRDVRRSTELWKGNNKLKILSQEILKQITFVDCLLPLCSESFMFVCAV